MKTTLIPFLAILLLSAALQAQDAPTLAIGMHPAVTVSGEAGSTYVIESKNGVDDDFWLTRGVVELTSTQAQWMDSVPADGPKRIYRAVKVSKPEGVQPVDGMVWIPAGRFTMGSPESELGRLDWEGPQTRVTLTQSFWMRKHEVTQGEYLALMGNNPSFFNGMQGPLVDYGTDLNRPVESLSWDSAVVYFEALTDSERNAGHVPEGWEYRLPTEAEWEYACRAGTTTRYSFGDALECDDLCEPCGLLNQYMWWCGNKEANASGTTRVGQKLPNPWGLYDMHGLVWEWCQDIWSENQEDLPGGEVTDPKGAARGARRVIRGGGFGSQANNCRTAYRTRDYKDISRGSPGIRPVLAPVQ